jgi:hypothetical protein
MRLEFVIGALACGLTVAGLTAIIIWVLTLITGSTEPWRVAPVLVTVLAAAAAVATYVAEVIVDRAARARKRATGEPWAYREK